MLVRISRKSQSYYVSNSTVYHYCFSGAKIDIQDNFGRAPLHVAAAVDYAEMVEFLINKQANINISTLNEQQTPIHFAAKNGACQSLKMLLAYGADIVSKDSKNRTPLQVKYIHSTTLLPTLI
jgi:ankyrin repeat protein